MNIKLLHLGCFINPLSASHYGPISPGKTLVSCRPPVLDNVLFMSGVPVVHLGGHHFCFLGFLFFFKIILVSTPVFEAKILNFPYFQLLADEDMQERVKQETCIFNSSPGFKVKL